MSRAARFHAPLLSFGLMARTRIKICGIRTLDDALAAVESGADALGFMFVRSSARAIDPESAAEIMWALPPMVTTVGVFMNASIDTFADFEEQCPTHFAQLHGNEDEPTVRACGPAIKTIRYHADSIAADLERWGGVDEVDAVLVDVASPEPEAEWEHLAAVSERVPVPLILAGDLNPGNVGLAIRTVRPFAVDVSAGVESSPGVKDPALIEALCDAVREADRA